MCEPVLLRSSHASTPPRRVTNTASLGQRDGLKRPTHSVNALVHWVQGDTTPEIVERDDGVTEIGAGPEVYLMDHDEWPEAERMALALRTWSRRRRRLRRRSSRATPPGTRL